MLENYYLKPETIDRVRACWLGEAIEQYVTWLSEKGYANRSICRRVPMLMHFADFAAAHGAKTLEELADHVDGFVNAWVRDHGQRCKDKEARRHVAHAARNPVDQMLRLVLPGYLGHRRAPATPPFATSVPGFFDYLREERGLRPASIDLYTHNLRRLERYLRRIELTDPRHLSLPILSAFISDSSQVLGKHSLSGLCGQLRVFLRYLYQQGQLPKDLSGGIDCPRVYRLSDIPRAISWEQVRQLLEAVDRRSPVGKRDYAILLLLITYGLRAREVAALMLDAIDWSNERLAVPDRKAGHSMIYPLSTVVGEAIIDYLQQARPQSTERALFLRSCAPHTPLGWPAISQCVARRLHNAGIVIARAGSHTLRHTCVQRLVEAHFSLKEIGDYIGHSRPESTAIYAKVDLDALREVALGDGEEVL
jgi:site-specific recombinase XerD